MRVVPCDDSLFYLLTALSNCFLERLIPSREKVFLFSICDRYRCDIYSYPPISLFC
jgi:hypothetical protein